MCRRFIILGVIVALSAGGWGGVLASALCARASVAASSSAEHDCCRKEQDETTATSCPMSVRAKNAEHAPGARTHAAHEATEREGDARPRAAVSSGDARVFPPKSCAHCVGRAPQPPAAFKVRASESAKRGDEGYYPAPRAERSNISPKTSFFPHVTPTQGAPPGPTARRHVLVSVFLI